MFNKIKKTWVIIWAVIASIFAVISFVLLNIKNKKHIEEMAEYEKEKTKLEIESTPAADLVDMAPNADALQRERNSITECFRQELRNRLEQKLHRAGSSRAD